MGAGTGQRGMEVSMSNWKFSTPWCTSICCPLKVTPSTPWERQMPGEMTTDNSKCQILIVLCLVILQPAKPAWLQRGGHLQLSTCQHTHADTLCQPMPRLCPFPGRLSPSSLMTWQTVFEKSLVCPRQLLCSGAELWQLGFSACWDTTARVTAVGSVWPMVGA